jgi:NAD(P) transhydrogenase subunit beta
MAEGLVEGIFIFVLAMFVEFESSPKFPHFLLARGHFPIVLTLLGLTLLLGGLFVLPIGAADMPVVISFLNACSGLAASAAGFVVSNNLLIIAGALVGASGVILTQIICTSMHRSLADVLLGAFGIGGTAVTTSALPADKAVHSIAGEEGAMMLTYAHSVVIVSGYGMAVAQGRW